MEISMETLFKKVAGLQPECLQANVPESELLQYIAFIKTMAIITSRGKVLSNDHLFLFLYSRFSSTIIRNLFSCNSVDNSLGK